MEQVKRFAFLLQPKAEYKAWIVTEKHFFKTATNPEDMRVTACFMSFWLTDRATSSPAAAPDQARVDIPAHCAHG
jgi:hypothetical protein